MSLKSAWISLSKGTNPEMNEEITFGYFCTAPCYPVVSITYCISVVWSVYNRELCRIWTLLSGSRSSNSVMRSALVLFWSLICLCCAQLSVRADKQLKLVALFCYTFVTFAVWSFSYAMEMAALYYCRAMKMFFPITANLNLLEAL